EHDLGEADVGLDGADRRLDDQLDADGGGEVVDLVAAVDELGHQVMVGAGVDGVVEAIVGLEVPDVVDTSGRQIVDDVDLVTAAQKLLRQVRANESGAAGDEITHENI